MATLPITKRGAEKLKEELHRLKTVDRPAVINAIAEARAQGAVVGLDLDLAVFAGLDLGDDVDRGERRVAPVGGVERREPHHQLVGIALAVDVQEERAVLGLGTDELPAERAAGRGELARLGLVAVSVSVTSTDPRLSGLLEPRGDRVVVRRGAGGERE